MEPGIYWVGVRESEIADASELYKGSITIFGSGLNGNVTYTGECGVRTNHNIYNSEHFRFYRDEINRILHTDSEAVLMFYNQFNSYKMDDYIIKKTICRNEPDILNLLRDKIHSRQWLRKSVPMLGSLTITGSEYHHTEIKKHFMGIDSFVVQAGFSSGGYGTWIEHKHNANSIKVKLHKGLEYNVTPYIHNNIPVNTHCVIYDKEIVLLPASVQIIIEYCDNLIYSGADFITFKSLDREIKEKINEYSLIICEKLQRSGYRGVCGIDYLIAENKVYFQEINERFQSSTFLLNKALKNNKLPTVHEMCIEAFLKTESSFEKREFDVPYSFYAYSTSENNLHINHIYNNWESEKSIIELQLDGYDENQMSENNAYAFKAVFDVNISSINPISGLNLSENIIGKYERLTGERTFDNILKTKVMLLNQGVHIDTKAQKFLGSHKRLREANFSSLDLTLFNDIKINCPFKSKFTEISPFSIDYIGDQGLVVKYYETILSKVSLDYETPLISRTTKNGIPYSWLSFLATDRLRIHYAPICFFKTAGLSCHFCDLPSSGRTFETDDIFEVINTYLKEEVFRHFLIGGGSESPDSGFNRILTIVKYIRSLSDKPIYLMALPPIDIGLLNELYKVGINEIGFNIEIYNRDIAKKLMPGKGALPLTQYFSAFNAAVKLWGNTGSVKSLMIYGLEEDTSFLNGIEKLCEMGVQPIVSIFRPLKGTPLENLICPSSSDVLEIYLKAEKICETYNLSLGPSCPQCQNNTLALTL